jgi:hypothetical protein
MNYTEIKNSLNKLVYILNIQNSDKQLEELTTDDELKFTWKSEDEKISCYFEKNSEEQKLIIDLYYDDDRSETVSYIIKGNEEVIHIIPLIEIGEEEIFNITNETITRKNNIIKATSYDYERYNKTINSITNLILNRLANLNISNNTKKK